ncbi:MAG: hypothetical protein JST51_19275 [Armatimonadetes bacterium]|nr:hypothetical protein [Armatimonadota bacterium]
MVALIAASILLSSDFRFQDDYAGIWADVDGNFLEVDSDGMHILRDRFYYIADGFKPNSSGDLYFTWESSLTVRPKWRNFVGGKYKFTDGEFFYFDNREDVYKKSDGFVRLGQPNSRGQILSFRAAFNGDAPKFNGGLAFVEPLSQINLEGKYEDDTINLTIHESPASSKNLVTIDGQIVLAGKKYTVSGFRKYTTASTALLDPVSNKLEGWMLIIWNPSPDRVSSMFTDDSLVTDQVHIKISQSGGQDSVAPLVRNLKREKQNG